MSFLLFVSSVLILEFILRRGAGKEVTSAVKRPQVASFGEANMPEMAEQLFRIAKAVDEEGRGAKPAAGAGRTTPTSAEHTRVS